MDALGFAAVVDGEIDVRTVSAEADDAKRQALFWLFSLPVDSTQDEARLGFLWRTSVEYLAAQNPPKSLDVLPMTIRPVTLN